MSQSRPAEPVASFLILLTRTPLRRSTLPLVLGRYGVVRFGLIFAAAQKSFQKWLVNCGP